MKNKFKNLIQTRKFKFSFQGLIRHVNSIWHIILIRSQHVSLLHFNNCVLRVFKFNYFFYSVCLLLNKKKIVIFATHRFIIWYPIVICFGIKTNKFLKMFRENRKKSAFFLEYLVFPVVYIIANNGFLIGLICF